MSQTNLLSDCKDKAHRVKTAVEEIIADGYQNPRLLENYLQCLKQAQKPLEKLIQSTKADQL